MHPSCGKAALAEATQISDLEACITGTGSLFRDYFKPKPPGNGGASYMDGEERTVLETFIGSIVANGTMIARAGSGFLTTATETPANERLAGAVPQSLRAIKETR